MFEIAGDCSNAVHADEPRVELLHNAAGTEEVGHIKSNCPDDILTFNLGREGMVRERGWEGSLTPDVFHDLTRY